VGIFNSLVDLGMMPIQDIPQLPKSSQEVLPTASLILEFLQEVLASDAGPWEGAWAGRRAHGFGSSASSPFHFLFFFCPLKMVVIYILTYIYIYKGIGKLVLLHP
jgi:hypothetical protein